MTCNAQRHTSQGVGHCHQPEHGSDSDHIAYIDDEGGGRWLATWTDRHPNHTDLTEVN